jgi:hypothetical protein
VNVAKKRPQRLWILGGVVGLIVIVAVALVQGQSTTSTTTSALIVDAEPTSSPAATIALSPASLQPVIGIENIDGKRVVIGGILSSNDEKTELIAQATAAFPDVTVVTSGIEVDAVVRPLADIATLLGALRQVQAPMSFAASSETTYSLRGAVSSEATKVAVFNGVAAGVGVDQNAILNGLKVQ